MKPSSILPYNENDSEETVMERRLAILDLARQLGNVSEACRRAGIGRAKFYAWKKRYDSHGRDGLADRPSPARNHPMRTPAHIEDWICALALGNPARGCNWLEKQLAGNGVRVSAMTIQKLLNRRSLGTRMERWLALEAAYASGTADLTAEQVHFMESNNPCLRDRGRCGRRPGEILCMETATIGSRAIGRPIKLHMIVDTFGSYAFAAIQEASPRSTLVRLLKEDVLPFYGTPPVRAALRS